MSEQLNLPLGRPSSAPEVVNESYGPRGWSMMSSTTGWLRSVWADDYLDRIIRPDVSPITRVDVRAASSQRDALQERFVSWRDRMVREKRGTWNKGAFVLNDGESPFTEKWFACNAQGKVDGRLFVYTGDIRIPEVNVDGEVYRAGERGNDRKTVIAEIMGTAFTPWERKDLLERIDSPEMWDRLLCHRMLRLDDLGPETERMIREENLSPESRENLLYNLLNMRRNREGPT